MKRNSQKTERLLTKGAQFGWSSYDPLAPNHEVFDTWIGHRNTYAALLMKRTPGFFLKMARNRRLKWKVNIEIEFSHNGKKYYRGADIVISGILSESDGHYQQTIEEIFSEANMKHYVLCRMTAEIIGTGKITDEDFEDGSDTTRKAS